MICGDEYPIISSLEYLGLINALTRINGKEVIQKIEEILRNDPNFFQHILKIVPIDFICETDLNVINQIVQSNYKKFLKDNETFRITLKRRKHESIEREKFIKLIAKEIDNPVDLENPDKIIRFEVLGNFCGISFLTSDQILRTNIRYE